MPNTLLTLLNTETLEVGINIVEPHEIELSCLLARVIFKTLRREHVYRQTVQASKKENCVVVIMVDRKLAILKGEGRDRKSLAFGQGPLFEFICKSNQMSF